MFLWNKFIFPYENLKESYYFEEGEYYPFKTLKEVISYITYEDVLPYERDNEIKNEDAYELLDYGGIIGQYSSKRALEIAAAGNHNIILYGEPGCGKTMLARAVAGESKVNFISLTSTDLLLTTIEASKNKINQIFDLARRYSPAIIFIDEIDAIGRERSGSFFDGVLNLLLTQMDGFNINTKHYISKY